MCLVLVVHGCRYSIDCERRSARFWNSSSAGQRSVVVHALALSINTIRRLSTARREPFHEVTVQVDVVQR